MQWRSDRYGSAVPANLKNANCGENCSAHHPNTMPEIDLRSALWKSRFTPWYIFPLPSDKDVDCRAEADA